MGSKGYLLGSDDLGRDILTRLVNGGRMSMTIGVAVAISTIIGVLVGSISGYFGGRVDISWRLTEMVVSLPFLPFATYYLSYWAFYGCRPKIWLIMVVLGYFHAKFIKVSTCSGIISKRTRICYCGKSSWC